MMDNLPVFTELMGGWVVLCTSLMLWDVLDEYGILHRLKLWRDTIALSLSGLLRGPHEQL